MRHFALPSFTVDAPEEWEDITATVDGENAPFTLARRSGVGALQFSIALYRGGRLPNPSAEELLQMIHSFGEAHALGGPTDLVTDADSVRRAAGSFAGQDYFVRAWYLSDGHSFGFVTYNCELGEQY